MMKEEERGELSVDDELSRQKCDAADATLAGFSRKHLPGAASRGKEMGKYFLLGDDILLGRPDMRTAFLWDQHGKEYIMAIRNKGCVRASCWRRGSLRGHDGKWTLECAYRLQLRFD